MVMGQAAGLAIVPALLIYYSGHFFLTSRADFAIFLRLANKLSFVAFQ